VRFLELVLTSTDPEGLLRFYVDTLELPPRDGGVGAGTTTILFVEGDRTSPYHVAFNIPPQTIDQAFAWARDRVQLLGDQIYAFESWRARSIYFLDPEGNILEFIGRDALARDDGEPFSAASIESVSEIGLPVSDPPTVIEELERRFGVVRYSGDGQQFTAVGDELGLLIVVAVGRPWFPTPILASENPLQLKVEARRAAEIQFGATTIIGKLNADH
jgi:catechol 2,3-dioxygenase-like lactoylglutathione lyase family enzyme